LPDGLSLSITVKEITMRRLILGLVCIGIVLCCAGLAGAANYYVAPSGGSNSNPGTVSQPWATLEKALATAAAGDTVYFRGGTHTASGSYYPSATAHAGTSGSPITLTSYPNETATITGNGISYFIRVEKPYWVFDGLTFIANNLQGSGGCIILNGDNYDGNHMTVRNCSFQIVSANSVDNVTCIRLQSGRSNYAIIQNNTFAGFHVEFRGQCGVQYLGVGGSVGTKILNNIFHSFDLGLMVKHANGDTSLSSGAEIAYNYFYDCDRAGLYGNPVYINYHDNLLVGTGISFGDNGGGPQGNHCTINHNTIYNNGLIFNNPGEGPITYTTVTNNVFMNMVSPSLNSSPTTPHYTTLDYNLYISGSQAFIEYGNWYSLATWKTHYGGDAHSISGSPTFVGGSTPTTIADFALTSGSTGHNAASDGKDLGADMTQVGIQGGGSPPTAVNDSYSLYANHTLTVSAGSGLLLNDTGTGTITAVKVTDPSHGSLSLSSDGSFTYTPTTGYTGSDSYTYKAHNSYGDSNTATVSITVNTPPAPTAQADAYSVYDNHTLTVSAGSGLLLNDTDSTGLSLTASKVSNPSHGTATVNSDGSFTYTPTTGYSGSDSFGYKAYNGFVYSSTATVSITINQPTRMLIGVGNGLLCSTTAPNSDGRYWNNFTAYTGSPSVINSCTTASGSLSGIKLTRTANFKDSSYSGISTSINGWPVNAVADFMYSNSTTTGSFEFSLLDTSGSKTYELTVFGGSFYNNGTSRYTVLASSTTSRDVNTYSNTTVWPTFSNLTPDANGKITLQVSLVSGGTDRAPISVMDLAIYDNGVGNYSMMAGQESSAIESASIAVAGTATKTVTAKASSVVSMAGQNSALALNINFQPASVVAPQGYLVDSGMPFGKADNGYTYGWTTDMSSFAAQLNSVASPDVRYDTAIMLVNGGTWELAVPNGMYDVKIVAGDSSGTLAAQKFSVEGVPMTLTKAKTAAGWSEETITVVVTDGRLTIVGNPGSSLCFVQITGR
jgi:hypothetical protein